LLAKTMPVGSYPANDWGLCDMQGNVWEWCSDWYGNYSSIHQTNPAGPLSGTDHVRRGGGWGNKALLCRSAVRRGHFPDYYDDNFLMGFRIVIPE